jgi:hypothetical protein
VDKIVGAHVFARGLRGWRELRFDAAEYRAAIESRQRR